MGGRRIAFTTRTDPNSLESPALFFRLTAQINALLYIKTTPIIQYSLLFVIHHEGGLALPANKTTGWVPV